MEVREEGIYRLTYEDLIGAGLPAGIDDNTFQLFNLGNETAIKVVSAGSYFGPGDYVEFHAQAVDNQYTGANVYWLYWGQEPGKRMGETDGTVTGGGIKPESFEETIHVEENHTMWEGMPGAPEDDYWFWEKFTAPIISDYTFDIPSPDTTAAEATVKVCFQGRSTATPHPNHHTLIYLNGTSIGDAFWDGDIEFVQEMTVSPGLFIDGSNALTIDCPGDTGAVVDIVYFNWIEVEYARYFEAMEDELKFTVTGDGNLEVEVQALSGPDIRLFDITDPNEVKEVANISIEPDGPAYNATFEDQVAGAKTYYVLTADRIRQPESPTLWQSANLESPANGADWIVITAKDFLASVEPLSLLRENQGLRVKVVSIEDVYNEFNYGLTDPKAIKGFLQYAYDNWEVPAPTYVFLIGDANIDFRDYWGSGKQNIVPPHLCHTSFGVTPTDNWYVCMDGSDDVLPDMFIGRIPASSAEMVAAGINKITDFENSTWPTPEKVLLTADNNEISFEDLNEDLVPYLPLEFGVNRVYLRLYANVNDATQDIISSIDEGMVLTNYVGHGSVTNWTGEYMFDSEDIPALTNSDRLTFVTAMTCLNGYFSQPFYYCLAEEFVAAEGKGAIGAFAPSGLGYIWEHEILDPELFSILFDQGNSLIGSLITEAKISAYAQGVTEDIMKTFTLFGDPACRLKIAGPVADFTADKTGGTAPLIVSFTDQSTGEITSWSWNFGDGGTSTLQNPTYTYNNPGTYTVTLAVTGPGGSDTETKTGYVKVLSSALQADFTADSTAGTAPLTVGFTDQSTGEITSWSWNFGDGGTSTDQSPTHIYENAGTYTVSLSIAGDGGTDTETKTDYISLTGSNGWISAYESLFTDPSELTLFRKYRDKFLTKTLRGRFYTTLLYRNSDEALKILLNNPSLMKKARYLIETNKHDVEAVMNGSEGTIYNTDEIVFFLTKFAKKASPDLRRLAIAVKKEIVKKQRHGKKFLGFGLK